MATFRVPWVSPDIWILLDISFRIIPILDIMSYTQQEQTPKITMLMGGINYPQGHGSFMALGCPQSHYPVYRPDHIYELFHSKRLHFFKPLANLGQVRASRWPIWPLPLACKC